MSTGFFHLGGTPLQGQAEDHQQLFGSLLSFDGSAGFRLVRESSALRSWCAKDVAVALDWPGRAARSPDRAGGGGRRHGGVAPRETREALRWLPSSSFSRTTSTTTAGINGCRWGSCSWTGVNTAVAMPDFWVRAHLLRVDSALCTRQRGGKPDVVLAVRDYQFHMRHSSFTVVRGHRIDCDAVPQTAHRSGRQPEAVRTQDCGREVATAAARASGDRRFPPRRHFRRKSGK